MIVRHCLRISLIRPLAKVKTVSCRLGRPFLLANQDVDLSQGGLLNQDFPRGSLGKMFKLLLADLSNGDSPLEVRRRYGLQ